MSKRPMILHELNDESPVIVNVSPTIVRHFAYRGTEDFDRKWEARKRLEAIYRRRVEG